VPHEKQRGENTSRSGLIGNHKHHTISRSLAMELPIHRNLELFRARQWARMIIHASVSGTGRNRTICSAVRLLRSSRLRCETCNHQKPKPRSQASPHWCGRAVPSACGRKVPFAPRADDAPVRSQERHRWACRTVLVLSYKYRRRRTFEGGEFAFAVSAPASLSSLGIVNVWRLSQEFIDACDAILGILNWWSWRGSEDAVWRMVKSMNIHAFAHEASDVVCHFHASSMCRVRWYLGNRVPAAEGAVGDALANQKRMRAWGDGPGLLQLVFQDNWAEDRSDYLRLLPHLSRRSPLLTANTLPLPTLSIPILRRVSSEGVTGRGMRD